MDEFNTHDNYFTNDVYSFVDVSYLFSSKGYISNTALLTHSYVEYIAYLDKFARYHADTDH